MSNQERDRFQESHEAALITTRKATNDDAQRVHAGDTLLALLQVQRLHEELVGYSRSPGMAKEEV